MRLTPFDKYVGAFKKKQTEIDSNLEEAVSE